MDADPHRDARIVGAAQLLEQHRRIRPVETGTAVFGVITETEHPEVAHLFEQRLVDLAGGVEFARPGAQFLLGELPHGFAKELMLRSVEGVLGHL